ncbi:MAG: DNA topology modulation protein [Gemmatimonadetes bacterium]|nr:DNA topology modulation protein [Gemmatimonadota bacterium]
MQRVLVIGSGGAGKTTFSLELAKRTKLPVIHLDAHFWRPGWVQPEPEEWADQVDQLTSEPRWIMDGNYGGTMERRLEACDTVVFLDRPRLLCLWRVVKRRLRHHRNSRQDLPPGCPEQLDLEFMRWIWSYPGRKRPAILERLSRLRADQAVVVLRTGTDVRRFLTSVASGDGPHGSPAGSP